MDLSRLGWSFKDQVLRGRKLTLWRLPLLLNSDIKGRGRVWNGDTWEKLKQWSGRLQKNRDRHPGKRKSGSWQITGTWTPLYRENETNQILPSAAPCNFPEIFYNFPWSPMLTAGRCWMREGPQNEWWQGHSWNACEDTDAVNHNQLLLPHSGREKSCHMTDPPL